MLWVDALLINQADDDEKSKQVTQMRRVYTGTFTERVLVWLEFDIQLKVKLNQVAANGWKMEGFLERLATPK